MVGVAVATLGFGLGLLMPGPRRHGSSHEAATEPWHMARPYGMAPVAFSAFVKACYRSGINPNRIGQTIGNHPLSHGYHLRDGVLNFSGARVDYCAAVDLGAYDLPEAKRAQFLHELTANGFACWYRHGGKWKGGEHIHAIYALLPMKPQLRQQVRDFYADRRAHHLRLAVWEKRLRHDDTNRGSKLAVSKFTAS